MEREKAFLLIAECKNFTKVSKILGLSVATISRYTDSLEAEFNCKLLQRSTRSITLTNEGKIFADGIRKALLILDESRKKICDDGASQVLKINCIPSFGQHVMVNVIAKLRQEYPRTKFELFCDQTVHTTSLGEFDLYIRYTEPHDSSIRRFRKHSSLN